jgi:hypothetical protein
VRGGGSRATGGRGRKNLGTVRDLVSLMTGTHLRPRHPLTCQHQALHRPPAVKPQRYLHGVNGVQGTCGQQRDTARHVGQRDPG